MSRAHERGRERGARPSRGTPYDVSSKPDKLTAIITDNEPHQRRPRAAAKNSDGGQWQHDLYDSRAARHDPNTPTEKLAIEGLHYEVSQDELYDLFERIGPLVKCSIKYDRSGRSTGSAIVVYRDVSDASRARQEYDGANAKGEPISITFAPMRETTSIRGAAGGDDLFRRLGNTSLIARLGGSRGGAPPANAPTGPAADRRRDEGATARRSRPGSEPRAKGRGRREERPSKATAGSLDAELDAFMRAPAHTSDSVHAAGNDTEMR